MFARARKGLSRLGARLRAGQEARIVAFGGNLTYDGYYVASLGRVLTQAYSSAVVETATRGLPGFGSERGVFRTRSARDLSPDFVIVEFAYDDARQGSDRVAQAVEGIVRQLRATDPDREIAFVYFGTPPLMRSGAIDRVLPKWESVAEYYGIPSFDANVLAQSLVEQGQAIWFERWPGRRTWDERRPIALLQGEGHHTILGGTILGSSIAQSMITMFHPSSLLTESELPKPVNGANFADAVTVGASRLGGDGWVAGPLADVLETKPIAVYFDQLSAAERVGARLRIPFTGRYATLWMLGSGGTIKATLGERSLMITTPTDESAHAENLLNEDENRSHVLEIEAVGQPAVIAGLDLLGQVLPEQPSNG